MAMKNIHLGSQRLANTIPAKESRLRLINSRIKSP